MAATITLRERLERHQRAFDTLVSLIPPEHYFVRNNSEEQSMKLAEKHMTKKQKQQLRLQQQHEEPLTETIGPKQAIKEATKKAKRLKLDPTAPKTVSQIQEQIANERDNQSRDHHAGAHTASKAKQQQQQQQQQQHHHHSSSSNSIGNNDSHQDESEIAQPTVIPPTPVLRAVGTAKNASELKARLSKRIEELRSKRTVSSTESVTGSEAKSGDEDNDETNPKTRQDILERRKESRAQRRQALLKEKSSKRKHDDTLGMDLVKNSASSSKSKSHAIEENVSFGKLDFGDAETKKSAIDAAGLLKKVEAKKLKLEKLKETDADKASKIEEKESWNKLFKMAEGVKVKDDVKLLKKTVKRQESEKKKSSMEWKERKDQQEKDLKIRMDKRQQNIQARIDAKREKKFGKPGGGKVSKKTAPSGKRPGFEGGIRKSKK